MRMAAKNTPQTSRIRLLSEADGVIGRLGELQRQIEAAERELNDRIERLRADAVEQIRPLIAERDTCFTELHEFAKENRADMLPRGQKSLKLSAGAFGWRMSPWTLVVRGAETALAELKARGLTQFIRTREELDRLVLRRQRSQIEKLDLDGLKFDHHEYFYVAPNEVRVELTSDGVKHRRRPER